jgi:hypothetical protein
MEHKESYAIFTKIHLILESLIWCITPCANIPHLKLLVSNSHCNSVCLHSTNSKLGLLLLHSVPTGKSHSMQNVLGPLFLKFHISEYLHGAAFSIVITSCAYRKNKFLTRNLTLPASLRLWPFSCTKYFVQQFWGAFMTSIHNFNLWRTAFKCH